MAIAHQAREGCVQFADPTAPDGMEVSPKLFLEECRDSAMARFRGRRRVGAGKACGTIEHPVPPKAGSQESTGMIVAHVSPAIWSAWESSAPGSPREKRAHVESEVHLALEDLADQDMHGYLALTDTQREFYGPDLVQLVRESLDRTTFSHLGRPSEPHWEGTLVERVRPPYLILALSIGFGRRSAGKPAQQGPVQRRRSKPSA